MVINRSSGSGIWVGFGIWGLEKSVGGGYRRGNVRTRNGDVGFGSGVSGGGGGCRKFFEDIVFLIYGLLLLGGVGGF